MRQRKSNYSKKIFFSCPLERDKQELEYGKIYPEGYSSSLFSSLYLLVLSMSNIIINYVLLLIGY